MMLLYATTVRLGMLLKKRRMVWSAKCLEPQSKTLFMATVLSCTQPVAEEYGKTENRKRKRPLTPTREGRARGVCTQQSAKSLMGQGFAMHEKTLTFVSRLAFFYILIRLW